MSGMHLGVESEYREGVIKMWNAFYIGWCILCLAFINKFSCLKHNGFYSQLTGLCVVLGFYVDTSFGTSSGSKWRRRISTRNVIRIKRPKSNKIYSYQRSCQFGKYLVNIIYPKINSRSWNFYFLTTWSHFRRTNCLVYATP